MKDNLSVFLADHARSLGAKDAKPFLSSQLPIDENVPGLCETPPCKSFGKCLHCPPHAMKPEEFRSVVKNFKDCLAFKIDVPVKSLIAKQNQTFFKTIFSLSAQLENTARTRGSKNALGLAAGSCQAALCGETDCPALKAPDKCRHPELARPSPEAMGVNVFALCQELGWEIQKVNQKSDPDETGLLMGLVLF